ncbi:MAG: hydantoinase B/oxoprolinase family protein [Gammaproteobacteria bacterium]|nr:hydantoinase B/oxoprolinase family protein [Gammaproteobacteria bacterium]
MTLNPVALSIFSNRIAAICDEMGEVLRQTSVSPNIKDRLDFSTAVFDMEGSLCAQAAHIPVHLGSMAYAMVGLVRAVEWAEGDMLIVNDPFQGGTHLPDVTLVAPVFIDGICQGFVANRAHHADIGASTPGSMPISCSLHEEGIVISPALLLHAGVLNQPLFDKITLATSNPELAAADFSAQISANRAGVKRLSSLITGLGNKPYQQSLDALNDYGERLACHSLSTIPDGCYVFSDVMEDDGMGNQDLSIEVTINISDGRIGVDFSGTSQQVAGNINCPLSVAAAAVYYVFRCLMPAYTPACAGSFRAIDIKATEGSLVNARYPAAVTAGNVETSSRIVDVVLGALAQAIPERIPAASQGTMNNLAMGMRSDNVNWDYYETLGGGMGAGPNASGPSAVQTHMTNTLNTPIEVLEMNYPLRVWRYQLRRGSGGVGQHRGGDGLVREYEFLQPAQLTLLTERRRYSPWGLQGGEAGQVGVNLLDGVELPAKVSIKVDKGARLLIETPGGGGWG